MGTELQQVFQGTPELGPSEPELLHVCADICNSCKAAQLSHFFLVALLTASVQDTVTSNSYGLYQPACAQVFAHGSQLVYVACSAGQSLGSKKPYYKP